jgi:hypothetical protein
MCDPWFPIALMLIVLLGVWLGIFGPFVTDVVANGILSTIKDWQTLAGASIALVAAWIAWTNVTR